MTSKSEQKINGAIGDRPVIIFDGVCNLCNSSVDFLIRHDKKERFLFTANQHETGKKILSEHGIDPEEAQTVFLFHHGQLYRKSTAALRAGGLLGFPWSLGMVFLIVPAFIRNLVYDFIARNRYKWFGKRETCRLPSPEEQARFLD